MPCLVPVAPPAPSPHHHYHYPSTGNAVAVFRSWRVLASRVVYPKEKRAKNGTPIAGTEHVALLLPHASSRERVEKLARGIARFRRHVAAASSGAAAMDNSPDIVPPSIQATAGTAARL